MNTIIFISWLATFVLGSYSENSISVEFAVKDCTSNCASIQNPSGKVRIYGYDADHPQLLNDDIASTEIIEQPFTATSVPFTLDIVYPNDPLTLIKNDPVYWMNTDNFENPIYFINIIWDTDENHVSNCDGDIQVDDTAYEESPAGRVDLNTVETQTVYVKQTEKVGVCEGLIIVKLMKKDCEYPCGIDASAGYGKITLYGYDPYWADVSASIIHQQDFFINGVTPLEVTVSFPENPAREIEYISDEKDAKYYITVEKCDLIDDGLVQKVVLTEDRPQTVYIKEYENFKCGASCYHTTFVKALLCLYFVFYVFV